MLAAQGSLRSRIQGCSGLAPGPRDAGRLALQLGKERPEDVIHTEILLMAMISLQHSCGYHAPLFDDRTIFCASVIWVEAALRFQRRHKQIDPEIEAELLT
jgi:hypothetical protein